MKTEKEIKELYKEEKEKIEELIKENSEDKKRETVSGKERVEFKKEEIEKGDYDKNKEWELIR